MIDIIERLHQHALPDPHDVREAVEEIRRLRAALEPFAAVGGWFFARPHVPDEDTVIELRGINGAAGAITRGQFKAASAALSRRPNDSN